MKAITVREAKSRLTGLIQEIEKRQPVRLTHYGKPVAVLISNEEFERMKTSHEPRPDFMRLLTPFIELPRNANCCSGLCSFRPSQYNLVVLVETYRCLNIAKTNSTPTMRRYTR